MMQCMLAATKLREDFTFHLTDDGKLLAIDFMTPSITPAACSEYQKVRSHCSVIAVKLYWRC
jgi:hypothetical protein